jgi:hypothetical protein
LKKLDSIRITYISGVSCGLTHWIRRDIALDLIARGVAKEVQ